jgi:hypothetical protein
VHGGGRPARRRGHPDRDRRHQRPRLFAASHASYGFYAEAVGDYVRHNLRGRADDPKIKLLYAIEDPYSYRERPTMPKFVVNASGDQYFPPDSSQFYFGDLPGEKYLRYVPNADHSLLHFANFLDCIRDRKQPNADVETAHHSTLLCHYGNIAYRLGRKLTIDPLTEGFVSDDGPNRLVKREYRKPWVVPKMV